MRQMSSSKKTVLVVTGTRADYGLLRPLMRAIGDSKTLVLQVAVTGMHTLRSRGYTLREIREDGMPVSLVVPIKEGDTMVEALAKEVRGIGRYCTKHRPDLILVLGDRDECFAGAIVGGHLGIPVAHIHGGDKTGFVVDEYIRHATTKFSHLHFAATKRSAERIALLGEERWRIHVSGGPGLDELRTLDTPPVSLLSVRYGLSTDKPWYVILHHPASLDPVSYAQQAAGVFRVATDLQGEKIILAPNSDTGSKDFLAHIHRIARAPGVHVFEHIPRVDLIGILKHARALVGNSSMGIIDASYLKLATVNVGSRQDGRERGTNVIDCGYAAKDIRAALQAVERPAFRARLAKSRSPYGDGRASARIIRTIERLLRKKDLFHKKLTYV